MIAEKPLRILHIIHDMGRAGAETWLMHVLRNTDRERFQMDFLIHVDQPRAYHDEIRDLGSEIVPCLGLPSRPGTYARNFKRLLRERAPYDIVHSHVHFFSGFTLRLARQEGVPVRISHSHVDTSPADQSAGTLRRICLNVMRRWININATVGLAASRKAAWSLFGPDWETDPRWRVLHYSIDLEPFRIAPDPTAARAELEIPADTFVVGHVGRFNEQKNHVFLVRIAAETAKREPNMRLLLIGDGPLRSSVEQQVEHLGIADRVIFAGERSDIPRLMLAAMDVFVLPSLYEGLPLVGIEAQAAGLPTILSDTITEEIDVDRSLIRRLSLFQPASVWAQTAISAHAVSNNRNRADSLALVEQRQFSIQRGVKGLETCYLRSAGHNHD